MDRYIVTLDCVVVDKTVLLKAARRRAAQEQIEVDIDDTGQALVWLLDIASKAHDLGFQIEESFSERYPIACRDKECMRK